MSNINNIRVIRTTDIIYDISNEMNEVAQNITAIYQCLLR